MSFVEYIKERERDRIVKQQSGVFLANEKSKGQSLKDFELRVWSNAESFRDLKMRTSDGQERPNSTKLGCKF